MRYFKPKALTWWASFVPLAAGLFLAAEDIHGMAEWVGFVNKASGDMTPAMLINAGLFGIGLRGAIKDF